MYIARHSAHIQSDITRNWSSWNFGKDGFEGTREELDAYIADCDDENPCYISGFELYPDQLRGVEFGELYAGYWVVIDQDNACNGLSCDELQATDLESAIIEGMTFDGTGDGQSFDASSARLVYSQFEEGKYGLHIFEI